MLLPLSVVALLLPTLGLTASTPSQLYFSPPLSSSSSSSSSPRISLTAPQANAVLAHHLGVSSYVDLPLSSSKQGGKDWEAILQTPPAKDSNFVIVLECPSKRGGDCKDLLPNQISSSQPYNLPSLPSNSYLAALSLHLHRLADSLNLSPEESTQVKGLKKIVEQGLKSVAGWQGWVGKELASWIGYDQVDQRLYKTLPIQEEASSSGGLLSELDFLDQSGQQFAKELENLVEITDSFTSPSAKELPKIIIVHLKGLKEIALKHSTSSIQYKKSVELLQQTLSATLSSYSSISKNFEKDSKIILLSLQEEPKTLLRKRQAWLHPFESPVSRYTSRTRSLKSNNNNHLKRSVFTSSEANNDDDNNKDGKKEGTMIVPSSSKCFKSLEDLNNQTASCLSHGKGVKGISTKSGNEECWVCKCGSTVDEESGKKTFWAGEGCEKVDLSGLGLILILAASVSLLYKIGNVELPGTLSAVGGNGGGHIKRD
ncbi:hypothetical protein JCM3765_002916 [Sporobolomyces pararoseus]